MQDPETGVDPIANDGEVSDELALARERAKLAEEPANGGNGRGKPIDEQSVGEEDDGQLFAYVGEQKVSLGSLVPRGKPVEHAFVFGSARRKGSGGLIPPEEDVLLVVRGKVGSIKPVYKRDDNERIEKVTVEQQITPKVVMQADSDEAMQLLAAIFERRGIRAA